MKDLPNEEDIVEEEMEVEECVRIPLRTPMNNRLGLKIPKVNLLLKSLH
jgi:hypothetical protein